MSDSHAQSIAETVERIAAPVLALAKQVYGYAEIAREEHRSSRACAAVLEEAGFTVTWGTGDLDTAFRAVLDSGRPGPHVGILAEYDALPGLGHACGHNLIAGASIGAALALSSAGITRGAIEVLGCPAEETGFGKPTMLRAGMMEGLSAALSFHGGPFSAPLRSCAAVRIRTYRFAGVGAHAGQAPWKGHNAVDAAVAFYSATAALRQHALDRERVHGIITDGGQAWNIVPERAAARFGVRARTGARADELLERLDAAARGAALMHGCTVSTHDDEAMQPLVYDEELTNLVGAQMRAVGLDPEPPCTVGASTDVGDVSEHLPTAMFYVKTWPADTEFHTAAAAVASDTGEAYAAMLAGARVMAGAATIIFERGHVPAMGDDA
jgi:amidohydrolase